jgi:tetratricopeptide (TPR) repeat protein
MAADLKTLERRALELMKQADFGPESIRVNAEIVELSPRDEGAWTRLGRCYLEQRQFDEAVTALRAALAINPAKTIATNLLAEVRKRRALTPSAMERATTGFSTREFALIEALAGDELMHALRPRMEVLFDTLNATGVASRIVEARRRVGESGSKLFHANSYHPGPTMGHVNAFHHGGRWEPQFNLGWFTPPLMPSCLRIGIGFNLSQIGRDPSSLAEQEQVLRYFERFRRTIEKSWQRELARWMGSNGGFIQYGNLPPALDMLPDRAVEWVLTCRDPTAVGWIFLGRWLFLDRPDDARVLSDRAKLASAIDDTFRTLYPVWLSTYTDSTAQGT